MTKEILKLEVPENRKPGKYLRKLAPEGFGDQFSELVESLSYHVMIAETAQDWSQAVRACTSCMSRDVRNYRKFWSALDVDLVVLIDSKGDIVARCLVNFKTSAIAPIYGRCHYLLGARLTYAGFKQGALAPLKRLTSVVLERSRPQTLPKSHVCETMISLKYHTLSEISVVQTEIDYWLEKARNLKSKYTVTVWGDGSITSLFSESVTKANVYSRKKQKLLSENKRYRKFARKSGLVGLDFSGRKELPELKKTHRQRETVGRYIWTAPTVSRVGVYVDSLREGIEAVIRSSAGYERL